MKSKVLFYYSIVAVATFFRIAITYAATGDPLPRNAGYVQALVESMQAADSSEAADVFLVPFQTEINAVAGKYKLPASLLAAFIQEESQFDPFAIRTEPHYLKKRKVIAEARTWSRKHRGVPTFQTELFLRASSMGLMQPLGQVAREQGFKQRFLSALIEPYHSLDEGAKHLREKIIKYRGDTLSAISAYNQGNNRKQGGVFVNARYVYRVSVAWRVYEELFAREENR